MEVHTPDHIEVLLRTRPLAALSILALSALVLAGCSGNGGDSSASPSGSAVAGDLCSSAAPSGAASEALTVEGDFDAVPTVTFEGELAPTEIERTVVSEGDGDPIADGDLVEYALTILDPTTGEVQDSAGYGDTPILPVYIAAGVGIDVLFGCAPIGTRIASVIPASDTASGAIYVVDVLGTSPSVATGAEQEPVEGMPTVVLDDAGQPTVTLPDGDMPTEFEVAALKVGDGRTVEAGDDVMVQYQGTSWNTGELFDQSWGSAPFSFSTSGGVVQGFADAVIGQTVGSQVIAVLPPAVAYGEGEINDTDLTGQTLVFVIDILAAQPAQATAQ